MQLMLTLSDQFAGLGVQMSSVAEGVTRELQDFRQEFQRFNIVREWQESTSREVRDSDRRINMELQNLQAKQKSQEGLQVEVKGLVGVLSRDSRSNKIQMEMKIDRKMKAMKEQQKELMELMKALVMKIDRLQQQQPSATRQPSTVQHPKADPKEGKRG